MGDKDDTELGVAGAAPKRTWLMTPSGVVCYKDPQGGCSVLSMWETEEETAFHDQVLMKASRDINGILADIQNGNKDSNRKLCMIEYKDRHLLVWATEAVGPQEDEEAISRFVKLKA